MILVNMSILWFCAFLLVETEMVKVWINIIYAASVLQSLINSLVIENTILLGA